MKAKELQELGYWKVGQEVVLTYPAPSNKQAVRIIDRITDGRKGTIYVGDLSFDIHGNQRGNGFTFYLIKPCSPEIKEGIIKQNMRKKLSQFDFNSLTFDQASVIFLKMREIGIVI